MDKSLKILFDQLDNTMIALNGVPSFKALTPEITKLRKELGKLAKIRNAMKRVANEKIVKVRPTITKISKPEFWKRFDGFMNNDPNSEER